MAQGMPALLSLAELKALKPVAPSAGGTVTLWGRKVPWRPLSVTIYDRYILSRFDAPNAFFTLGEQVEAAHQVISEMEAKGLAPDPELLRIVDTKGYTKDQASDGGAANMAFIAAGIGAPGNEEIERQLLDASDDELETSLTTIEQGTWGDDPARFFGEVGKRRSGRILTILQRANQAKGETPGQPSSKATSTKTAGKGTTTASRKMRQATKPRSRSRKAG